MHSLWAENGFYTLNFQYLNSYNFHTGEIIRLSRVAVVPKKSELNEFEFPMWYEEHKNDCSANHEGWIKWKVIQP